MKYTMYLSANVAYLKAHGEIVNTRDITEWSVGNGVVSFWVDEEKRKSGFYKIEDVLYILPKE